MFPHNDDITEVFMYIIGVIGYFSEVITYSYSVASTFFKI